MRFAINPFTELLDIVSITGSGAPPIETITGNTGGPVGPDPGTFNLNLLGDTATGLTVSGNAGTYTLTIEGIPSSTTQVGTTRYATNAEAAAQTIGTAALTPANITSMFSTSPLPASQGGTGLSSPAAHSLFVSNGSSPFTLLGVASNGQLPIGSAASDPVLATLTAGTGISIVNGPGSITITNSAPASNLTLTADSGTATEAANNINVFGTSAQGISTSGSGSTLTITAANATDTQKGVASFNATNFTVTAGNVTSNAITLTAGTGVSITGSPVNLGGLATISAAASVATTYTADSGSATPSANNLNLLGSGSITSSGSGSTITYSLTGLTNHNVLVGAASSTITKVPPSATSGVPFISQGASADPTFGTAVVAGGGTGATSLTAHSLLLGQGTSPVTALGAATNGQLPIGSTGVDPVLATLTAGSGINITNGAGSITIACTVTGGIVTINGDSGSVTGTTVTLTGGTTGLTFSGSSTTMTMAGTLVVSNGGTGRTTLTNHGVLVGAGTSAITQLSVGATGTVLAGSTGADPSFTATPTLTSVTFGSGTALNTYQQGTFTPGISFGGGTTGITYSTQAGQYTQIGNVFYFTVLIVLSNKGSSTGTARVTGFPITTGSGETASPISQIANLTFDAGYQWAAFSTQGASGGAYQLIESGTSGYTTLSNTNFANNTRLEFSGFFFA